MSIISESWEYFVKNYDNTTGVSNSLDDGKLYWDINFETDKGLKNISNNTISSNPAISGSGCTISNRILTVNSGNIKTGTYRYGTNSYISMLNTPIENSYIVEYNIYDLNTSSEKETSYDIFEKISELVGLRKENKIFFGLKNSKGYTLGFVLLKAPVKQKIVNAKQFARNIVSEQNAIGQIDDNHFDNISICESELLNGGEYVLGFVEETDEKEYTFLNGKYYYKNSKDVDGIKKINFSSIGTDGRKISEYDRLKLIKVLDQKIISAKLASKIYNTNLTNEVLYPTRSSNTVINANTITEQSPLKIKIIVNSSENQQNIRFILGLGNEVISDFNFSKPVDLTKDSYSPYILANGFNNYFKIENFKEEIIESSIIPDDIIQPIIKITNGFTEDPVYEEDLYIKSGENVNISILNPNINYYDQYIKYTLDDTIPTQHSALYLSPIKISVPKEYIIRAYVHSISNPSIKSLISTRRIVVHSKLKTPVFETNVQPNTVVYDGYYPNERSEYVLNSDMLDVKVLSSVNNAIIYYTLNGDIPDIENKNGSTGILNVGDSIKLNKPTEIIAIAVADNYGVSDIISKVFYVKYANTMPAPIINLTDLSIQGEIAANVEITSINQNATIYYTIDGTDPTIYSNVYIKPFKVSPNNESLVVKAMVVLNGFNDSEVAVNNLTFSQQCTPWKIRQCKNYYQDLNISQDKLSIFGETEIIRTIPYTGSYFIDFDIHEIFGNQSLSVSFEKDRKDTNYYGDKHDNDGRSHFYPIITSSNGPGYPMDISLGIQNHKFNFHNYNHYGMFNWAYTVYPVKCRFLVKNVKEYSSQTIHINHNDFKNNAYENQHRDYFFDFNNINKTLIIDNLKSDFEYFLYIPSSSTDISKITIILEQSDVKVCIREIKNNNNDWVNDEYHLFGLNKIDRITSIDTKINSTNSYPIEFTEKDYIISQKGKYILSKASKETVSGELETRWIRVDLDNYNNYITGNTVYTAMVIKHGNKVLRTEWSPAYASDYEKLVIGVYGDSNRDLNDNDHFTIGNITGKCNLSLSQIESRYRHF